MKTFRNRVCIVGALVALVALVFGFASAVEVAPAPRLVHKTAAEEQAATYRKLFEKVGRAGLADLTKDKDTSLALHASWEINKKLVKRAEKGLNGGFDTYDPNEVKKFLGFFKERTKATIPEWWEKAILNLEVDTRRQFPLIHPKYYTVEGRPPRGEEVKFGDFSCYVRKGTKLTLNDDVFSYKSGGTTLVFPKSSALETFTDVTEGEIICLARYGSSAGFKFYVAGFEKKTGKRLWESQVWAIDRRFLAGPPPWHRVDLTAKDETVFVFGAELGGMYVEGFDLATGKCRFRFCPSYWGEFSEQWDIK